MQLAAPKPSLKTRQNWCKFVIIGVIKVNDFVA
jgi:hypothetical protein